MVYELFDLKDINPYMLPLDLQRIVLDASRAKRERGKLFIRNLVVSAGATMAEPRVNYTNVFNGAIVGNAPEIVDIATDNDADNDKTVTLVAIDENDEIVEASGTLALRAASTTELLRRINEGKISTAATGTITVHEDGATVKTYLTIATAATDSVNMRFYIPDGKEGIQQVQAFYNHPAAAAGYLTTNGALVKAMNSQHPVYDTIQTLGPGNHDICTCPSFIAGDNNAYFTVQLQAVDTDIATPVNLRQTIIVW